jgi:hypothetical protein
MKIRVIDVARPSTFDIDPDGRLDVAGLSDSLRITRSAACDSIGDFRSWYSGL